MNSRNSELRDALEFGSPEVIARVCTLLAQRASQMASLRKGAAAQDLVAMGMLSGLGTRVSALIDAADAKRRCLDGSKEFQGSLEDDAQSETPSEVWFERCSSG